MILLHFLSLLSVLAAAAPATGTTVQARMQADADAGKALVAHVIVALCDNEHQGIVPVKPILGDGEDIKNNLYWGAFFGVKRFLTAQGGWKAMAHEGDVPQGVLERVVLKRRIRRKGKKVDIYVVAEAWRGARIKEATGRFLRLGAGQAVQNLKLKDGTILEAGGRAHLVAYIGHDGLMDFVAPVRPKAEADASARSAVVLACMSEKFFKPLLDEAGAHSLCLTSNLMPPEAYTLDALIKAWFAGKDAASSREAGAKAFAKFQKCSQKAARRLFVGEE